MKGEGAPAFRFRRGRGRARPNRADRLFVMHPHLLAAFHLGFGLTLVFRPNLFELFPVWGGFLLVMTQAQWAAALLMVGAALLLVERPGVRAMIAEFLSATMFLTISGVISAQTGINTGSSTYLILGGASILMFADTALYLFKDAGVMRQLIESPPAWVVRWLPPPPRSRKDD